METARGITKTKLHGRRAPNICQNWCPVCCNASRLVICLPKWIVAVATIIPPMLIRPKGRSMSSVTKFLIGAFGRKIHNKYVTKCPQKWSPTIPKNSRKCSRYRLRVVSRIPPNPMGRSVDILLLLACVASVGLSMCFLSAKIVAVIVSCSYCRIVINL